jgi:hypothetical protein
MNDVVVMNLHSVWLALRSIHAMLHLALYDYN